MTLNIPLVNQPVVDMAHCPKCEKELLYSHSIGKLENAPVIVCVAWCTHCKHLLAFQFVIVAGPPAPAAPQGDPV